MYSIYSIELAECIEGTYDTYEDAQTELWYLANSEDYCIQYNPLCEVCEDKSLECYACSYGN